MSAAVCYTRTGQMKFITYWCCQARQYRRNERNLLPKGEVPRRSKSVPERKTVCSSWTHKLISFLRFTIGLKGRQRTLPTLCDRHKSSLLSCWVDHRLSTVAENRYFVYAELELLRESVTQQVCHRRARWTWFMRRKRNGIPNLIIIFPTYFRCPVLQQDFDRARRQLVRGCLLVSGNSNAITFQMIEFFPRLSAPRFLDYKQKKVGRVLMEQISGLSIGCMLQQENSQGNSIRNSFEKRIYFKSETNYTFP